MTIRAIFRLGEYSVTGDNAKSVGVSKNVIFTSIGTKTPFASFNQNSGLQRIDSIADEAATPTVAGGATYTADLSGITTAFRTLLRINARCNFRVTITPTVDAAYSLDFCGSNYQPGQCELHLENIQSLTITNLGTAATTFYVALSNVVDYDDPALGGVYPPDTSAATGTNANLAPGLLPLGAIIPIAGTYTGPNNTLVYDEGLVLPLADWLKYCDGSQVTDLNSIMFGRYVPDLSDDRFIMGAGSTAPGVVATAYGGANTRDLTHTHQGGTTATANVNTTTRTTNTAIANQSFVSGNASVNTTTRTTDVAVAAHTITQPTFTVDAHTHGIAHNHQWGFRGGNNPFRTTYSLVVSDATTTVIDNGDTAIFNSTIVQSGTGVVVSNTDPTLGASLYTTGVLNPPTGTAGSGARSSTANVNTTTRTTNVALSAHSVTQPTFTVDAHTHTTSVGFSSGQITQPTFTVDAHTHSFNTTAATWTNTTINGAPTTVDIRPRWIAFKYYMRIK